jgi:anti-sigma28 factor (negative regulator of flagellin synthesis)
MISSEIVNEVARILRQSSTQKDAKEVVAQAKPAEPRDEVELTATASDYVKPSENGKEYEKEQSMKVARIKALVASGNYKMDEDMVKTIASRIAQMFLKA